MPVCVFEPPLLSSFCLSFPASVVVVKALCHSVGSWNDPYKGQHMSMTERLYKIDQMLSERRLVTFDEMLCWRAFKTDHLCALNFDQAYLHRI